MDVAVDVGSSDEKVRHGQKATPVRWWYQGRGTLGEGCVHPNEQLLLWGLAGMTDDAPAVGKVH